MNEAALMAALGSTEPGTIQHPEAPQSEAKPKSRRGFASMDPAKVAEIARKGGAAAHAAGTAHKFTKDEARAAGAKGGRARHRARGRTPVEE